jgi:hypothetical protein
MRSSLFRQTAFLVLCSSVVDAQQPQAKELLARALHLADLYNWVDAAPAFAEAQHLFIDAGDQRNALYAKLGVGGGEKGRQFGGREGARCEVTLWPPMGAGMERKRLLLL